MARSRSFSSAVEDYLKAIYRLEGLLGGPVSTTALADALGLRAASISGMLKKLDDLGFVTYLSYHGFTLSEDGRRTALAVIRRHRLVELFLAEMLGVSWDEVHDEAEALEHSLSPKLCDLIEAKLGYPALDPHGDPIPNRRGELIEPATAALTSLDPGVTRRLVRVSDRDSAVLRTLSELGIGLGTEFEVLERHDDGSMVLGVRKQRCSLRPEVADAMSVEA